ncbi:MAG: hypothetical protein K2O16_07685 [Lachnospiraceae bacterium]|nr:hypothetical protein [Lachnospiraceae bacterium]
MAKGLGLIILVSVGCDGAQLVREIAEKDIPEQELKNVVEKAGYDVVSVSSAPYEKKGLLSAFRG